MTLWYHGMAIAWLVRIDYNFLALLRVETLCSTLSFGPLFKTAVCPNQINWHIENSLSRDAENKSNEAVSCFVSIEKYCQSHSGCLTQPYESENCHTLSHLLCLGFLAGNQLYELKTHRIGWGCPKKWLNIRQKLGTRNTLSHSLTLSLSICICSNLVL